MLIKDKSVRDRYVKEADKRSTLLAREGADKQPEMTWASIEGIGRREEELLSRVSLDGDHEQIKSMQLARRQSAKKKGVTFNSDVKEDGLNTDRPLNEPEKIADEEN